MIGGDDDDGSVFGSYVSNIGLERLGNVVCPMDSIRVRSNVPTEENTFKNFICCFMTQHEPQKRW